MKKILFIRRDNIGDLVCSTPAIAATRTTYPGAKIAVFVNSYNEGVIRDNPDVDEVYVYRKAKHHPDKGAITIAASNLALIRRIRSERFDAAVGLSHSWAPRVAKYTRLTGARTRIGFVPREGGKGRAAYNLPVPEPEGPIHEVEASMRLVEPLGVTGPPPPMKVIPDGEEVEKVLRSLGASGGVDTGGPVCVHISSRRPENRWPREHIIELIDMVQEKTSSRVLLLWSPGSASNPLHPGDDELAEGIIKDARTRPLSYRTGTLTELIAALSISRAVVCPDGGAMHLGAALGKPVVTVWGSTDPRRWAPWGVPSRILQKEDRQASSVTALEALGALEELIREQVG